MSTSPNIEGPVTLNVLSFTGLNGCQMQWRAGDTQPQIKLQLLGGGVALNLASAVVTINFFAPGNPSYIQSSVMTLAGDNETLTYERQPSDFTTINPGTYYFAVTVAYTDGTGFTAPDNGEAILQVEPQF